MRTRKPSSGSVEIDLEGAEIVMPNGVALVIFEAKFDVDWHWRRGDIDIGERDGIDEWDPPAKIDVIALDEWDRKSKIEIETDSRNPLWEQLHKQYADFIADKCHEAYDQGDW